MKKWTPPTPMGRMWYWWGKKLGCEDSCRALSYILLILQLKREICVLCFFLLQRHDGSWGQRCPLTTEEEDGWSSSWKVRNGVFSSTAFIFLATHPEFSLSPAEIQSLLFADGKCDSAVSCGPSSSLGRHPRSVTEARNRAVLLEALERWRVAWQISFLLLVFHFVGVGGGSFSSPICLPQAILSQWFGADL